MLFMLLVPYGGKLKMIVVYRYSMAKQKCVFLCAQKKKQRLMPLP